MTRDPDQASPAARRRAIRALDAAVGDSPLSAADHARAYRILQGGVLDAALTLIESARRGDRRAAEAVLRYTVGRPAQVPDPYASAQLHAALSSEPAPRDG